MRVPFYFNTDVMKVKSTLPFKTLLSEGIVIQQCKTEVKDGLRHVILPFSPTSTFYPCFVTVVSFFNAVQLFELSFKFRS